MKKTRDMTKLMPCSKEDAIALRSAFVATTQGNEVEEVDRISSDDSECGFGDMGSLLS